MRFLYDLQTRLGLTAPEGSALLTLALAGALSVGAMEWQGRSGPSAASLYAEADSAFAAASRGAPPAAQMLNPSTDAPPPPVAVGDSLPEPPAPPTDSASAKEETAPPPPPVAAARPSGRKTPGRANLNTGTSAELQRLPGVGPALAQRIIDYRTRHGPFRRVDDVVGVKGIGDKTLEKMRPYAFL